MKHLLIILSILLLSSPVIGQSSKPRGVIIPPTVMGNVSYSRKQILLNTLDEVISKCFDLSPPTNVSSGDLPEVEDAFQLQIVEEDGDTQLSLRWTSGNDRRVETQYCEGCKTFKLNGHLKELVKKLVGVEGVVLVKNNIVVRKKKGILLPVSAPFHCKLMNKATDIMSKEIAKLEFKDPKNILISNVTGKEVTNSSLLKDLLIKQIESPVRWRDCLLYTSPSPRD